MPTPRAVRELPDPNDRSPPEVVDIHCHCLPGLDDGPATDAEALSLCRALAADGITTVIATPHQFGRYDRSNAGNEIRLAVQALRQQLAHEEIPLRVEPGADIRVDERIIPLLRTREVVTLADKGRHLLLELPHDSYIDPLPLIRLLGGLKIQAIMSHPERHPAIVHNIELVRPWLDSGAILQVTAGSLSGDFGTAAKTIAWDLLQAGAADLVATDAHNVGRRPPRAALARRLIERELGAELARRVCQANPQCILEGVLIEPWGNVALLSGESSR